MKFFSSEKANKITHQAEVSPAVSAGRFVYCNNLLRLTKAMDLNAPITKVCVDFSEGTIDTSDPVDLFGESRQSHIDLKVAVKPHGYCLHIRHIIITAVYTAAIWAFLQSVVPSCEGKVFSYDRDRPSAIVIDIDLSS